MPNDDTMKLLAECDSGCKMAVDAINHVLNKTDNVKLHSILEKYLTLHQKLQRKIIDRLDEFNGHEQNPSPISKAMSTLKIRFKLIKGDHDKEIADVLIDGCNMGIKSINRYINQYPKALECIKKLCCDLAETEEQFIKELIPYL